MFECQRSEFTSSTQSLGRTTDSASFVKRVKIEMLTSTECVALRGVASGGALTRGSAVSTGAWIKFGGAWAIRDCIRGYKRCAGTS